MALFVPVLRITMLFLNVYDSYKTLKPPPPSLRDPTRPSIRASTQRKRDMKGCLAVWIIWCSFNAYERIVESIVSLFIPFYDEFKSMFMLFLILTRARGAEPIFLHIVRPLVKPYVITLDGTLDLLRMVGDFVFALSSYPVHMALAWWYRRMAPRLDESSDSDSETETDSTRSSAAVQHEIWVPPQAAYESDEELNEPIDAPPEILDLTREERAVEEWQRYPAFPSAYPTTPVSTTSQLAPVAFSFSALHEEQSRRGFHRSLLLSRNSLNPSYTDGLSDRTPPYIGIYHVETTAAGSSTAVETEDDDSVYEEEDEDVYNMTLRTPLPPHGAARSRLMPKLAIPGPLASAPSQSTAVSSAHTAASFRTGGSESSHSPSTEESSSDVDLEQTIRRSRVQVMEDLSSTHLALREENPNRRQLSARKRKVSGSDLQELSATSDTVEEEDDDSEMPSPISVDDKEEENVYVIAERPEVKRRRLGTTPRKASVSSARAIHPPRAIRRPLAARQTQQTTKSGQTAGPHISKAVPPVAVRRSLRPHAKASASTNPGARGGKRAPSSTGASTGDSGGSVSASVSSTSSLSNPKRRISGTASTAEDP